MNKNNKNAGLGAVGFLIAAIISAGFATYLVAMLVRDKGLKSEPTTQVLVAARPISAGTKLAKEDIKAIQIAESLVPPDAVTSIAELFGEKSDKAPVTSTGMVQGDFIIRSRFADSEHGTAMAAKVSPGMRAVAVTVDAAIARSRLVFPGAHVDVVGTFRNVQASFSRVLVENVRVLSLEDQIDVETYQSQKGKGDRSNDAVVTVEVTPEQSEIVALAAREGKLDLMLRNSTDEEKTKTAGAQTEQLLKAKLPGDGSAAPTQAKAAEPPRRVERPRVRPTVEAPKVETKSNSGGGIEVVRSSGGAR
jgi:pilus assembly protein CpaB